MALATSPRTPGGGRKTSSPSASRPCRLHDGDLIGSDVEGLAAPGLPCLQEVVIPLTRLGPLEASEVMSPTVELDEALAAGLVVT